MTRPSLAGSAWATSVATGRTTGTFLFTLPFDSRVYERQADGSTVTLFDFARAASRVTRLVGGSQMLAIVGGNASRWTEQ